MRRAAWEPEFLAGGRAAHFDDGRCAAVGMFETREAALHAAFHEAAHAVAAALQGFEVRTASIFHIDDTAGRCVVEYPPVDDLDGALRQAAVHIAGAAADSLRGTLDGGQCGSDFGNLLAVARDFGLASDEPTSKFVDLALRKSVELLSAPAAWAAVEAVARQLLVYGSIGGVRGAGRVAEAVRDPSLGGEPRPTSPLAEYEAARERDAQRDREAGAKWRESRAAADLSRGGRGLPWLLGGPTELTLDVAPADFA